MTADDIKNLITAGLACDFIHIDGDGRHWYATIVSAAFEGKNSLARQRMVNATVHAKMVTDELHALSMKTLTPAEWAELNQ